MDIKVWQRRTWELVETGRGRDLLSRAVDVFILGLILGSVVAIVLSTVQPLASDYGRVFNIFEIVTVMAFSVEYLLRLWSCVADPRYAQPWRGRLRFVVTPLSLVDLLSILPFYLWFLGVDLRFLRIFRLLRLFKSQRYKDALLLFVNSVRARREELLITLSMTLFLLLIASCLMYYAEHAAQPNVFRNIPDAMWWAVVTLTTVGYGDIVPVTFWGRVLGAVVAVLGMGLFALPAGLLASGFIEQIQKRRQPPVCPHCGKRTDQVAHE